MLALPVFLDANALMPISLADLLLRLTEEGLIEPFWSQHVLDSALRAAQRQRPDIDPAKLTQRFTAMKMAFPEAMIDTKGTNPAEYPSPDPEDQLVMAAAHRSPAHIIITRNLAHFPQTTLDRYQMKAQTADRLLLDILASNRDQLVDVFQEMQKQMKHPPLTVEDMLDNLAKAGVPDFAAAFRTPSAKKR